MEEREITEPVRLCRPDGRLDRDAVGWTRTPVHDTSGIGRGRYGRGRNKRWEYWAVTTPTHVLALTASHVDYAGVHEVFVLERASGRTWNRSVVTPFARGTVLPPVLGGGPVRAVARDLRVAVDEVDGGTRLRAEVPGVDFDVVAHRPEGHEAMGVVVPWSERLFQYTVKDVARPATGTLRLDGRTHELPDGDTWAVLDHGRGRWPYRMTWNWGAGSGRTDGRVVGVQVGGRWTEGTGSTENALVVDGRVHKISEELAWEYDRADWLAPWRVRGDRVDLVFTPEHLKASDTNLGVLASHGRQCFGTWSGWMADDEGARVPIRDVTGWAEEVGQRW